MSRSILIVDDEFGLADILCDVLVEAGFTASIAINGQMALERMLTERPDLVLLDLMMPILDGTGTLQAMKQDPRLAGIPVIVMTAVAEAVPPRDLGWQIVLLKPFSADRLLAAIDEVLGPRTQA